MSRAPVRDAYPDDAGAVFALARAMALTFTPDRDAFDATVASLAGDPGAHLLVVEHPEEPGEVAGYLLGFDHPAFFANGRVGWIEEVSVRNDLRRRGLGAALVAAFEQRVAARGARLVALATTRAGRFYGALGYTDHAAYHRKLL